jgi:hypothetical protein
MPGLPTFYGHVQEDGWYYYVWENLPPAFGSVEDLLLGRGSIDPADLVSRSLICAVVDQAAQTFAALWSEGYVYTDFCIKNIFRDDSDTIRLTDVDSCWSIARLARERHPNGTTFGIKFWDLWNTHVAAAAPGGAERAPYTLVLSFAAVWLRALALKRRGGRGGARQ